MSLRRFPKWQAIMVMTTIMTGRKAPQMHRSDLRDEVFLRRVLTSDCRMIWEWANDPESRRASFTSREISWEEHITWFEQKLVESQCVFLAVVQEESSNIVGSVRFQIEGDHAVISINIAPSYRGRGIGQRAIRLATLFLFENTSVDTILATIRATNVASIRAFQRSGYHYSGQVGVQDAPARQYEMKRKIGTLK